MKAFSLGFLVLLFGELAGCIGNPGTLVLTNYGTDAGKYQVNGLLTQAVAYDFISGAYIPNASYPYLAIGKPLSWQEYHSFGYPDGSGKKYVWKVGGMTAMFIEDPVSPAR